MNTSTKIVIGILVIGILGLVARYVVFADQFEEWGAGLERVGEWEESYKAEHPNATKEEMDAAFEAGIERIDAWKAEYKEEHPNATDAEVDAAFEAAWDN